MNCIPKKEIIKKHSLTSLYLQEGERIPLNLARQIYPEFFLPSIQKLTGDELDPYLILALIRAESFSIQQLFPLLELWDWLKLCPLLLHG